MDFILKKKSRYYYKNNLYLAKEIDVDIEKAYIANLVNNIKDITFEYDEFEEICEWVKQTYDKFNNISYDTIISILIMELDKDLNTNRIVNLTTEEILKKIENLINE